MKTKVFFLAIFSLIILSCEVEEESGYGNFIIAVSNASDNNISMQVLLDDNNQGSFVILANQEGNYSTLCNDLVYAATVQNVKILNFVSSGTHNIKLKDDSTGDVYFDHSFEMTADGCGVQQYDLN